MAEIRVFFNPRNIQSFRNNEKSMEQILPHSPLKNTLLTCDVELCLQTYEVAVLCKPPSLKWFFAAVMANYRQ